MPTQLGKYTLVRTLGCGANSKVAYSIDQNTNKEYAIKVMHRAKTQQDNNTLKLIYTEIQALLQLKHKNIINLIEYNQEGIMKLSNGKEREVFYIVLELAQGGELFDFVAQTGAFSEQVARYYFRQMIEALQYIHSKGFVHRDLKPENLLLDKDFNLKVADFGFSHSLVGKFGNYQQYTLLGTLGYMAPEIITKAPYHGDQVDLFACGVILFIMVARHPPFQKADPKNDKFYNILASGQSEIFWQNHSINKPNKDQYFSQELKNLITLMLQVNPAHRLTLQEIKAHPWYNMEVPSYEQIYQEFLGRKQLIIDQANLKKIQKQKLNENQNQKAKYKAVDNNIDEEDPQASQSKNELKLYDYIPEISTNCEIFSNSSPSLLYQAIWNCLDQAGMIGEQTKKDKYKIKIQAQSTDETQIDMICRLLRVNDDTTCIQFTKKLGDKLEFYEQFQKIKEKLNFLCQEN